MAETDTERAVNQMQRGMRLFTEDLKRAEASSKGVAKNITELGWQIKYGQRNFMEYIGQSISLEDKRFSILKEVSGAIMHTNKEITDSISAHEDSLHVYKTLLEDVESKYSKIKNASLFDFKDVNEGRKLVAQEESMIALEQKRFKLKQSVEGITGKQLAVEFMMYKGFSEALKRSSEINESIISSNSYWKVRREISDQIYTVQAKTGASMQQMLSASKALTSVWPKGRTDLQSTLEVMVQMEQGLGVSYENSAQLARVFEISLKTPVREVADQIAIIANSTSLTADEATRFATEIGKAMRILGAGGDQAKEITKYVEVMAARMKDAGGDSQAVVEAFKLMT